MKTLQDRLDAFRVKFESEAPAAAVATMHRATAALIASGQASRALRVGDTAPSFALSDATGTIVTSSDLLAKGPLVLTFYRGVWCPYCNIDLEATESVAAEIRALGATLVAISPQNTASSRKTADTIHTSFPILSDRHGAVATAFGLRFRLPDDLIDIYRKFGVDLPTINGDESWTLPMPARYVVGQDGKITYAEVSPDYTCRSEPGDLLPALKQLYRAA